MKEKILLLCFAFFSCYTAKSQFNETIRTGRPGQAIGPFAVGRYVFQTQTGFDYGGVEKSAYNLAGNTVCRFGITRHFEINTAWEYRSDQYKKNDVEWNTNGLSLGAIGTRINLFEGKGAIPAVGLQATFKLPILSKAYNFSYVAPKVLLIANQKLSDKFNLLVNFGVDYNGNNAAPTGVYVINISYSICEKWGTFVENYGNFTPVKFENRWDCGFAYLLNDNLQLDLYGGAGYNNKQTDYFTSIGISWRFITLRKKLINE